MQAYHRTIMPVIGEMIVPAEGSLLPHVNKNVFESLPHRIAGLSLVTYWRDATIFDLPDAVVATLKDMDDEPLFGLRDEVDSLLDNHEDGFGNPLGIWGYARDLSMDENGNVRGTVGDVRHIFEVVENNVEALEEDLHEIMFGSYAFIIESADIGIDPEILLFDESSRREVLSKAGDTQEPFWFSPARAD